MLAGDFAAAEQRLRTGYEALEAMGERALSARRRRVPRAGDPRPGATRRGRAVQPRSAEELAEPDDLLTQIMWRGVRARLLAARGSLDDAERLAREAVALAEAPTSSTSRPTR